MSDALESLVSSLLFEGYCLYPYTPGSVKNATPTPFGIVYPPAYAARQASTFDHLQIECLVEAPAAASLTGTARFLQASGDGHQAVERRVECPLQPLDIWARVEGRTPFAFDAGDKGGIEGRVLLAVEPAGDGVWRARLRIENLTLLDADAAADLDRRAALERSLLSTHALVQVRGGRFISPVDRDGPHAAAVAACRNVNTWPVLATDADDAVLGAAIFLPDHPQLAPESQVNFFDNTEIEEALMLHVQVLSDDERAAIEGQDAAVRDMIARAEAASPEERFRQHGVMRPVVRPELSKGARDE
ncbi:MAG: hypothetical protein ABI860_02785 [Gemmatimonadales bacterium]